MADLKGYVNPRTLGNDEPCHSFGLDVFFEKGLWDKYIMNKDVKRRNLYTWDAAVLAAARMRRAALSGATEDQFLAGFEFECKIGHHKPCTLRTFHHPEVMAWCVGLAGAPSYRAAMKVGGDEAVRSSLVEASVNDRPAPNSLLEEISKRRKAAKV